MRPGGSCRRGLSRGGWGWLEVAEPAEDSALVPERAAQLRRPLRLACRRILRVFAIFAAVIMLLIVFDPAARAAAETTSETSLESGTGEPGSPPSGDSYPSSLSSPLPADLAADSPGGPSPPPGEVTSVYTPPKPVMSALPPTIEPPRLDELPSEYRYTTVAGVYAFPKAAPYLMRHESAAGELFVKASTFVVLAPGVSFFSSSIVLNATDYRYQVRYNLVKNGSAVGNVTLTLDLYDDGPPKITAELRQSDNSSFALTWLALTLDPVAFNGTATLSFGTLAAPKRIETQGFRLSVGPDGDPANWTRRLVFNWSDARAGTAFAGRFAIAGLEGMAVLVKFPEGMAVVDPSLVGTSTSSGATSYSIQRKSFAYADRIWAFWYDGSNIAYSSSRNGTSWSTKMSTPSGAVASQSGFDVDQRNGTVLIGYVFPSTYYYLKVLKGTITGSFITWSGPFTVANLWTSLAMGPPTVAIGTDGYYWIAVPYKFVFSYFSVYRSDASGSTSFLFSTQATLNGEPPDSVARLLAMANGEVHLVVPTKGYFDVKTYHYGSYGWSSAFLYDLYPHATENPANIMSAIALPDSRVRTVFVASTGRLREAIIWDNGPVSNPPTIQDVDTRQSSYPTISVDANGDSHVFYRYVDSQDHVVYRRTLPLDGFWSEAEEPFSSTSAPKWSYTAIPFSIDRVALIWTEGSGSPYSVKFGAVATPMDLGSQTGDPWNRQGLSPFQGYFSQFSEYVSPGSGLLTVKQTDLVLPGRGLDLVISRVFTTPRAFSSGPYPYLYESYPSANLGAGWQLDFPWLTDQYIHLWNGQMYAIKWDEYKFENHDGEHFVLAKSGPGYSYSLVTRSGIAFRFSYQGLWKILDPSGSNVITFSYGANGVSSISDTIGRQATFAYNIDGTLLSIASGGRTVSYGYGTVSGKLVLTSVKDFLGRETRFEYTDTRSPYLMTAIRYPTGGSTEYAWGQATVGTDLTGYYVVQQNTKNSAGQSIRSNQFSPQIVNGKVTYTKVATTEAGTTKGYAILHIDSVGRRLTTIRQDATGVQLSKEVSWFGASGGPEQVDVYPGSSTTLSHSLYMAYDDWGNLIYSRDAVGHERFSSYVNTRFQGGFYAPGRLARASSGGLLFYDDFEDRDLSDWTLAQPQPGSVKLDYQIFESLPPSLNVSHTGGATGVTAATHTFSAQSVSFVAEVIVRAQETNRQHYLFFKTPGGVTRVYVALRDNGYISWYSGSAWSDVMPYQANQWYRVAFEVDVANSRYDLWINGKEWTGLPMVTGTSGNIDRVSLQASDSGGGAATMHADAAKVYEGGYLVVTDLQAGQIVKFEDSLGRAVTSARVATGATSVTLEIKPSILPYGTVKIYDSEGFLIFSSQTHEFWGGEFWTFAQPWKEFPSRTRSGFLRYNTNGLYVDEGLPGGAYPEDMQDGWDWGTYDFPVSGTQAHRSKYLTSTHEHRFRDATSTLSMASGQYHIQYVFIPDNQYPSEIMLEFRDTANSWDHRAYWGSNLISKGTDGTSSRRSMGDLPGLSGRWLMLIVKADDVGMNGNNTEGLAYTLYGGRATWDFSARGDSETGEIRISGLSPNWKADLYDPMGALVASATVTSGDTAAINVYGAATKIRAFPFEGFFLVRDSANAAVYRSPMLSFWGGDVYNYGGTNFYPNWDVSPDIHDRLVGTLEFQTGQSASPSVRQEAYYRYTSQGLLDLVKVRDESGGVTNWRETSLQYDGTYGLPTLVTDPLLNSVNYAYSPTYGRAYVTQVTESGRQTRYTYNPATGWLLSQLNPRGYLTRHEYDALGRPAAEYGFDLPTSSEVLYMDMEWTTEDATPRMQDLSGRGNHGTITGTTIVPGKVGQARDFNPSTTDRIIVSDSSSLDIGTELTVSAWVKTDTIAGNGRIVEKGKLGVSEWEYGLFRLGADVRFNIWKSDGSDHSYATATSALTVGSWVHVAGTYKKGTATKVYINGVEWASSTTFTGNTAKKTQSVKIGAREGTSGFSELWDGTIDEVRIFNRALSAAEIATLYDNSYGLLSSSRSVYDDGASVLTSYEPTTKPRVAHLDMETLLNGKLEDMAGAGLHGTMAGTTATTGKVGGARDFNGVSDRVVVPDASSLDIGQQLTVSVWIKTDTLGGRGRIVEKGGPNYPWEYGLFRTDSYIEFIVWQPNGWNYNWVGGGALVPGQWHHVVGTYQNKAAMKLYVDGVLVSSSTTFTGTPPSPGTQTVKLGAREYSSGFVEFFDGSIDEVQIFDRALNASEVSAIYQGTEKGFYAKQYFDSIGRATRLLKRDLFGASVSSESYSYNFQDLAVSYTSPTPATTSLEYDFFGRLTKVTYPDTANPLVINFDDVNRIRTVTAENGRKVQYISDVGGRTTTVREYYDWPNYYATSYAYDEVGNLVQVTNALNQVTTHEYDNLNRLTKTLYPDAKYENYTYDAVGNLKTKWDRSREKTTYSYDARYRLTSVDYPGTTADVSFVYDENDNPTWVQNPSATIGYSYDGLDRVRTETSTVGGTSYPVSYLYDRAGRVTQLTYPDSTALSYVYDAVGRAREVKTASVTYGTFAYYADDRIKNITFGTSGTPIVQSYLYHKRGWPTSIKATSDGTTYFDLGYTYDDSGNVKTMGSASFTPDKLDRLKTASGGFGSHTYTYDALGNRKQLDISSGAPITLRPNGVGSTMWRKFPSGPGDNWDRVDDTTSDGDSTYVYESTQGDTDLYAMQDLSQSGPIQSISVVAVAKAKYEAPLCDIEPCDSNLKLRVNGYASSVKTVITTYMTVSYTWTVNPGTGQPWNVDEVNALQAGIELVDTITEVRVTQLYVTVNFGGSTTYSYNDGVTGMNQLTSMLQNSVTTTFGYDNNLNLISQSGGGSTRTYEWGKDGLMSRTLLNGAQQQKYFYDGLGRRVKVEGSSSTTWTVSVFSGQDVIYEKDNSGVITKFIRANGMLLAKLVGTTPYYYLGDHLGSTRQVRDANRGLVFQADYEPFGKPYSVTGSEAYKFTGERQDAPTSLIYLRARQYDPDLGRFVSADPVLGALPYPQTLNRYGYVINNPLKYTDPTGEFPWLAIIVAAFLIGGTALAVSYFAPETRPYLDVFMGVVGFFPIFGDIASTVYFGGRDAIECVQGNCDPATIGLDFGGALPLVPSLGGVRAAKSLPKIFGRTAGRADEASDLLKVINRADFATPELRSSHFGKHGLGMGYRTPEEYLAGAKSLLRKGVRGEAEFWRSGRHFMAVNPLTGTWAKLDVQTGVIKTFFTPDQGYAYVLRQIEAQRWVRFYV